MAAQPQSGPAGHSPPPSHTSRHQGERLEPGGDRADPEALDLDTASVFSRSGLTNTHTTSDAGTAFDWRAYAAHLVRTYHQEHSREEIRAHRFAPREIRVQLFDQMAQQQGVKPTLGDAHFLNDLANATWIDFREREPPRTRGRINPRGTDGAPTPESTETPSGNSTHNA